MDSFFSLTRKRWLGLVLIIGGVFFSAHAVPPTEALRFMECRARIREKRQGSLVRAVVQALHPGRWTRSNYVWDGQGVPRSGGVSRGGVKDLIDAEIFWEQESNGLERVLDRARKRSENSGERPWKRLSQRTTGLSYDENLARKPQAALESTFLHQEVLAVVPQYLPSSGEARVWVQRGTVRAVRVIESRGKKQIKLTLRRTYPDGHIEDSTVDLVGTDHGFVEALYLRPSSDLRRSLRFSMPEATDAVLEEAVAELTETVRDLHPKEKGWRDFMAQTPWQELKDRRLAAVRIARDTDTAEVRVFTFRGIVREVAPTTQAGRPAVDLVVQTDGTPTSLGKSVKIRVVPDSFRQTLHAIRFQ